MDKLGSSSWHIHTQDMSKKQDRAPSLTRVFAYPRSFGMKRIQFEVAGSRKYPERYPSPVHHVLLFVLPSDMTFSAQDILFTFL